MALIIYLRYSLHEPVVYMGVPSDTRKYYGVIIASAAGVWYVTTTARCGGGTSDVVSCVHTKRHVRITSYLQATREAIIFHFLGNVLAQNFWTKQDIMCMLWILVGWHVKCRHTEFWLAQYICTGLSGNSKWAARLDQGAVVGFVVLYLGYGMSWRLAVSCNGEC